MTTGERIKARREEIGMSVNQLADKINKSRSTVYRYENGDIQDFPARILESLAQVLRTTPADLLGFPTSTITENIVPISTKRFPLYDGIAAGQPRLIPDGIEVYVEVTTEIRADFVLKVHGDSMTGARIHDGDLVFIRQQPVVENGEIAAVAIGDEATLKRVFWYANKTLLVLRAENPEYKDMEFSGEDLESIKILGKAIAFQSDVR
jgi:repressor LexA